MALKCLNTETDGSVYLFDKELSFSHFSLVLSMPEQYRSLCLGPTQRHPTALYSQLLCKRLVRHPEVTAVATLVLQGGPQKSPPNRPRRAAMRPTRSPLPWFMLLHTQPTSFWPCALSLRAGFQVPGPDWKSSYHRCSPRCCIQKDFNSLCNVVFLSEGNHLFFQPILLKHPICTLNYSTLWR